MTDTASPLGEANPESLDELFDRINLKLIEGMPETITDEDLIPVVARLRAQRLEFLTAQNATGRAPSAPRKKKPTSVAEAIKQQTITLDADDL